MIENYNNVFFGTHLNPFPSGLGDCHQDKLPNQPYLFYTNWVKTTELSRPSLVAENDFKKIERLGKIRLTRWHTVCNQFLFIKLN